ncbi:MAG: hypothetical protein Kow00121_04300 [Elainellaceae cyanobacterium]
MSLCINPKCPRPDHAGNDHARYCASCGSDLLVGGRYRALRLLSDKTGFGKIYEAYEHTTPKILKVLKENWNTSSKVVELFEQEAQVLGKLSHPGIPKVDGYFQHPVSQQFWATPPLVHCIAMEKVDGLNLDEWMVQQGNHSISQKQAIQWLKQVVEVLGVVHTNQYFHRDIKPGNIMLHRSGQLVLIDFGTARDLTYSYAVKLQGHQITAVVSPGFTPLEQTNGQANLQSDFFALGRTFVQLLTGKHPLELYDAQNDTLHWHDRATHVSPLLLNLIDRLMSRLPGDRPANTEAISQHISEIEVEIEKALQPYLVTPPTPSFHELLAAQKSNRSTITFKFPRFVPRKFNSSAVAAISGLVLLTGAIGYWLKPNLGSGIDLPFPIPFISDFPTPSDYANLTLASTLNGHTDEVEATAISPDGQTLASGGADDTIKLWNLKTNELVRTLSGRFGNVLAVAISPDQQTLVSGNVEEAIEIWNLKQGELIRTLSQHSDTVIAVAVSSDGQTLVSGGGDNTVKVWSLQTGELLHTLADHASPIWSVAISPDGKTIVSSSWDETIKIWDLQTGELLRTLVGHSAPVRSVVVSPDGKTIVSGSDDDTIKLWELDTGELIRTFSEHSGSVYSIAISPDGQTIVSGSFDKTVKVWNLLTGELIRTLSGHSGLVTSVAISPDGHTIVSGSQDKTIKVWRLE